MCICIYSTYIYISTYIYMYSTLLFHLVMTTRPLDACAPSTSIHYSQP